jgi:hypothetical protein
MNNLNKLYTIELLNFEGPALTSSHYVNEDTFYIHDELGNLVNSFNRDELLEFINGSRTITDSRDKIWKYTDESIEAKPSIKKLYSFIYDISEREIAKTELINLLLDQVEQLVFLSKIELSTYVQKNIKQLMAKIHE